MLSKDQWYQIVTRVQNRKIDVFVNGELIIHENWIGEFPFEVKKLFLGKDLWQEHFNGLLSQLNYWKHPLDDAQIKDLFVHEKPEVPLYSGVVAYIPFSGDSKSLNQEALIEQEIKFIKDSVRGKVALFNGENSFVDYGSVPLDNSVSISAWVKPRTNGRVLGALVSSGQAYAFRINWPGELLFTIPQVNDIKTKGAAVVPGIWQHVAVTYHEGIGVVIYKNGTRIASFNCPDYQNAEKTVRLGNNLWNDFYDGLMDDVIIWNRILSDEEIRKVYETTEEVWSHCLSVEEEPRGWAIPILLISFSLLLVSFYHFRNRKKRDVQLTSQKVVLSTFLVKVNSIVEENLSDSGFTVDGFAEAMYMSRTKLYNEIKAHSGKSPKEFIRDMRINLAAKYLAETDNPIKEIAFETGFESRAYFNKCFRKKYAMTPTEYRKQNMQKSNQGDIIV